MAISEASARDENLGGVSRLHKIYSDTILIFDIMSKKQQNALTILANTAYS